ncbi:response regulator transcription factor [Robertkochia flava]|uniref:response regulator transcription factor n=1 Tax=Robertkochia flava TaxID=3447986 RepID=UPI001CD01973|nr:response regulator transcription factor [Robertkochia marina]
MENKASILLVEDDQTLGYLLREYLGMKGFTVTWVKNGLEALEVLGGHSFDLAILDVMMPEMDGFSLARRIKEEFSDLPFIFLTARSLKIDVLKGFSLGAIDYLKKPVDEEELVVRIDNLLRLVGNKPEVPVTKQEYRIGGYAYDPGNLSLIWKGEEVRLTSRENEVLLFLTERLNKVSRHKEILTSIWGKNDYFNRKSLNVFITRLRKHLEKDPSVSLENIHNEGFILRVSD